MLVHANAIIRDTIRCCVQISKCADTGDTGGTGGTDGMHWKRGPHQMDYRIQHGCEDLRQQLQESLAERRQFP